MSDLISRQSAINALYHHLPHMTREECAAILHEVEVGNVETEQKTGKWIQHFIKFPEGQIAYGFECSVCGKCIDINRYSKDGGYCFCPNCGAQMDGGEPI